MFFLCSYEEEIGQSFLYSHLTDTRQASPGTEDTAVNKTDPLVSALMELRVQLGGQPGKSAVGSLASGVLISEVLIVAHVTALLGLHPRTQLRAWPGGGPGDFCCMSE